MEVLLPVTCSSFLSGIGPWCPPFGLGVLAGQREDVPLHVHDHTYWPSAVWYWPFGVNSTVPSGLLTLTYPHPSFVVVSPLRQHCGVALHSLGRLGRALLCCLFRGFPVVRIFYILDMRFMHSIYFPCCYILPLHARVVIL